MHTAIQLCGLFVGIWFTACNATKAGRGYGISWINFALMSAAWTAFIWATWLS